MFLYILAPSEVRNVTYEISDVNKLLWEAPEELSGYVNLYELKIVSNIEGVIEEKYVYLHGHYNQCQFYGSPCDYTFFVRGVNLKSTNFNKNWGQQLSSDSNIPDCLSEYSQYLDESIAIFSGPWSKQANVNCYFENMTRLLAKILCFFILFSFMFAITFKLFHHYKKMSSIKIILPAGFDIVYEQKEIPHTRMEYDQESVEKPLITFDDTIQIKPIVNLDVDKSKKPEIGIDMGSDVNYTEINFEQRKQTEEDDVYLPMRQISATDSGIICPKDEQAYLCMEKPVNNNQIEVSRSKKVDHSKL